ncbi:hypothetical protein [Pantanalinema sp. GBBB05]|uniref:hypothetical protein n=1 Tax=Pantanalinema sp. GBBB05 TaxID=2604139 RepID=UPI001DE8B923|nr:hypothetical protein [Pantanalinema sp. GBBB05]
MPRLNQRAFDLLQAEVQRLATNDIAGQVQQEIALKRLERLRSQTGDPADLEELQDLVSDLFPNFSRKVLKQAAAANQPPSPVWGWIKFSTIALTTVVGGIWFVNLPFPMIRYPVARYAPILLLPSYLSMDHNYRQAIAATEQADQLVNQATSPADLGLGRTKVKQAQTSLDALPVWFLGYYPTAYCGWFQCQWRFTLDEFQQARKEVARMDARLFQEENAQTALEQAEGVLGNAKQQYQEAPNSAEQQAAIAQWQQAIDTLHTIPQATLAGRTTATKLQAYERDFEQVVGFTVGNARTGNLIQAAKEFAKYAQASTQGTAHSVAEWEKIQRQWQDAVDRLNEIKVDDPDYGEAQRLLASYKDNLETAQVRQQVEQASVQAYQEADRLKNNFLADIPAGATSIDRTWATRELHQIKSVLQQVKPGTTVYADAQTLLAAAEQKLKK